MRKAHQYCYSTLKIKSMLYRIKRPKVSNLMKETNFKNKITSMENAVTNTSKLVKNYKWLSQRDCSCYSNR